jgi:tryptophanyl-tRNA synthetase
MLKNLGFKLVHIQRNIPNWFNEYKSGIESKEALELHISETSWIRENFDYVISNEFEQIEMFHSKINEFIKENFDHIQINEIKTQTQIQSQTQTQTQTQTQIQTQSHCDYLEKQFGLNKFVNEDRNKLDWVDTNLVGLIKYHRGFESFDKSKLNSYYLYTGRGPSQGTLHIGHLLGLELVKSISSELESKIFFMIADDEKILRDSIKIDQMKSNVDNTLVQLDKLGFNYSNTTFHINSENIGPKEYAFMIKLMNFVSLNELINIFGKKTNIGEYFYVFYQMIPCFLSQDLQCIVVCGIDQEPFFRLARYLAKKIGFKPPIILYTKNVPGLDGSDKMSTSVPTSNPIFLTDSAETIKNKIMSVKKVGAGTLDELFEFGANLESDTLIELARLFETNRKLLDLIEQGYSTGYDNSNQENIELIEYIKNIIPFKGIKSIKTKTMITTFGVRYYLINLIKNICSKYNV